MSLQIPNRSPVEPIDTEVLPPDNLMRTTPMQSPEPWQSQSPSFDDLSQEYSKNGSAPLPAQRRPKPKQSGFKMPALRFRFKRQQSGKRPKKSKGKGLEFIPSHPISQFFPFGFLFAVLRVVFPKLLPTIAPGIAVLMVIVLIAAPRIPDKYLTAMGLCALAFFFALWLPHF